MAWRVYRIDTLTKLVASMTVPPGDFLDGIYWVTAVVPATGRFVRLRLSARTESGRLSGRRISRHVVRPGWPAVGSWPSVAVEGTVRHPPAHPVRTVTGRAEEGRGRPSSGGRTGPGSHLPSRVPRA